jgi:hypothetical protein
MVHAPAARPDIAPGTDVDGEDVTTHAALRLVVFVSVQPRTAVEPPPPPRRIAKLLIIGSGIFALIEALALPPEFVTVTVTVYGPGVPT